MPKIEQWMRNAAKETIEALPLPYKKTAPAVEDMVAAIIASHAPSALNRNDTIEYWMTRATTAELKLQEFAKLLDESKASEAAAQPISREQLLAEQKRNYEQLGEFVPEIEHDH